jgi:hypothetical protein
MTKEEIYEHLANVYLGKKKSIPKKEKRLTISVLIGLNAILILGLFGFTVGKWDLFNKPDVTPQQSLLSLTLGNYPLRLTYNFGEDKPQIQNFSMHLPNIDLRKFDSLIFSIRSFKGKTPKLLKISLENKKRESSRVYFSDISERWQKVTIPLDRFKDITDWSAITKISFIFEAWNLDSKNGKVLIDNVTFASIKGGNS